MYLERQRKRVLCMCLIQSRSPVHTIPVLHYYRHHISFGPICHCRRSTTVFLFWLVTGGTLWNSSKSHHMHRVHHWLGDFRLDTLLSMKTLTYRTDDLTLNSSCCFQTTSCLTTQYFMSHAFLFRAETPRQNSSSTQSAACVIID